MPEKRNDMPPKHERPPPKLVSVDGLHGTVGAGDPTSRLRASIIHPNRAIFEQLVKELLDEGVSGADIIDIHIPAVARWLGAEWCTDCISFAEVSIGCARLQGLIRELDARNRPAAAPVTAPSVLLVIPADAYHTLGAMVALSKFRRLGVSVRLLIIRETAELVETVRECKFDMIAISASGAERLEMLRMLVKNARTAATPPPPVVIGGSVLELEPNIALLIGADHASADPEEALRLCGLKIPIRNAEFLATGL